MKPITVKFSSWLPKLVKANGITLGYTIYFDCKKEEVSREMFAHEMVHAHQVSDFGGLIPFLFMYVCEWVRGGFSYSNNSLEKKAYAKQGDTFDEDTAREYKKWIET